MSHFGLKGSLPLVEAAAPAEKVYYGLYEWQGRQYYSDDGGGSDKWEKLLAVHEDPDALRQQMNDIWKSSDLFEIRGKYQMSFKEGEFETNSWYHDGGGCAARGGYRIKAVPSLNQHLAKLQKNIDGAQAERDKRAEEDRLRKQEEKQKKVREAERIAYWEKRKAINEKHRAWRAANKDAVNEKQRAYRKGVRAAKKIADALKAAAWNAFDAEYKAWREAHPGQSMGDAKYQALRNKHFPKVKK